MHLLVDILIGRFATYKQHKLPEDTHTVCVKGLCKLWRLVHHSRTVDCWYMYGHQYTEASLLSVQLRKKFKIHVNV
jgi:hypothetical protein